MIATYRLGDDGRSITCLICGSVSHSPGDVKNHYCVACHVFHDDLRACARCGEPLLPMEDLAPIGGAPMHWECGLRMAVGGLNHQLGRCSCCGGTEPPDPPELSRRQAARAAVKHYLRHNKPDACQ